MISIIITVNVSLGRSYSSSIYFIFSFCMESNTLEKSTNCSIALRLFSYTPSMIRQIVCIFDVVVLSLLKAFGFFLGMFSISGLK